MIFLENKAWAEGKKQVDPNYFKSMARDQNPDFLWIGCADSRVPPTEITNTHPGTMFVHRNVANLVVPGDLNLLSVVQFAVEVLKVPHVIVCGHYNCGGVKAALLEQKLGLIDEWLKHIKLIKKSHDLDLNKLSVESEKVNKLVELNVVAQVENLANIDIIQKAWDRGQELTLHGWVYDLKTGLLKDLIEKSQGPIVYKSY